MNDAERNRMLEAGRSQILQAWLSFVLQPQCLCRKETVALEASSGPVLLIDKLVNRTASRLFVYHRTGSSR